MSKWRKEEGLISHTIFADIKFNCLFGPMVFYGNSISRLAQQLVEIANICVLNDNISQFKASLTMWIYYI